MQESFNYTTGWIRDVPDNRDISAANTEIVELLARNQLDEPVSIDGMIHADLRQWFPPVEKQGEIHSCSAHAGVALIEYFQRRVLSRHEDLSRLYLYKMARKLGQIVGDGGARIRDMFKAIIKHGLPPEKLWPYDIKTFDNEPSRECQLYVQDYQKLKYYKLDPEDADQSKADLKMQICSNLVFGFPCVFGFHLYKSHVQGQTTGKIPYPTSRRRGDGYIGGHAAVAVGFDNDIEIVNEWNPKKRVSKGAFLIRNSWGSEWGDNGYGWLPFDYVTGRYCLAFDWWSIVNEDWLNPEEYLADRGDLGISSKNQAVG